MITAVKLKSRTAKDLAAMAKRKKVPRWHSMRKDQLVRALVRHAKAQAAKKANGGASRTKDGGKAAKPRASKAAANGRSAAGKRKTLTPYAKRRLKQIKKQMSRNKDLAFRSLGEKSTLSKDRLVVMVRDPFWLHVYWEMTRSSIDRAKAALGQHWHGAKPVLRLNEVSRKGTTSTARRPTRDIVIHGGVNNWYIDVQDPPKSYQVDIGYLALNGRFHAIANSNIVSTPPASANDSFDKNWSEVAKDFDRVYAMSGGYGEQEGNGPLKEVFEKQLRRPMGGPMDIKFGAGAGGKQEELSFRVDTELIVHGETDPSAHVTFRGEPIHLREDGTFAVRLNLPDRRHVLPVVASSPDGVEQRTIVLAIDRNTKVMEPIIREPGQ
ncbi:MAG: DUF4912 domain-containing protein [Thermoguttaceae bacterium]